MLLGTVVQAEPPLLTIEPLPELTRGRTITVRGETAPGAEVTVTIALQTAKLRAGADGRFEAGPLELMQGSNDVLVTVKNAGGAAYTTSTVAADWQPPAVMLDAPWDAQPEAEASGDLAAIRGSTEAGCQVSVRLDGRELPAVAAGENGKFMIDLGATVPDGTHRLELVVADPAGNETRVERRITTDASPPQLLLYAPADTDFMTRWRRLAVRGQVEPGARLRVRLNGEPVLLTALEEDGEFAMIGLPLRPGGNELVLEAVDGAGNRSVLQRQVTLDNLLPELILDSPLDAPVWRTATPALVVRGRCEPGAVVTVEGLPTGPLSAIAGADGRVEGLVALLPASSVALTITARDRAGNATALRRWVSVDRQPPAIQLTSPGPLPYIERSPMRVAGRTEPGALVKLQRGGSELQTTAAENGLFEFGDVAVVDGRNALVLTATDPLGNARVLPFDVTARLQPVWLQVTEPEEGWQSATPTRLAMVAEADARLSATLDGRPLKDWTLAPPQTSDDLPWRAALATLPALVPGPHKLVVTAISPSGLRHSEVNRPVHVPGVPRSLLIWGAEPNDKGVVVSAQALDDWDMPVADGTLVEFRAPVGWLIDGREAVTVATVQGDVKALLVPVKGWRKGIALVSVGRVTESVRLPSK